MSEFLSLLFSSIIQVILFCFIPFIWWLITDRKTNFFHWIGLKKPIFKGDKLKILGVVLVVVAFYTIAVSLILTTFENDTTTATSQFAGKGLSAVPSIFVYAIIQTSLSEELFFRGFLCKRFIKQFGFIAGNTIQSVLFGLLHGIPFGLATDSWLVAILLTILPAMTGYMLGWLNEKQADGSILPSWMLHALINMISGLTTI